MVAHARAAQCYRLALALLLAHCGFDPTVRPLKPEQLSHDHVQVLATLDARGEYVLLAVQGEDGSLQGVISKWHTDQRCDVPLLGVPVGSPLLRPSKADGPALYQALSITDSAGVDELVLVDERCQLSGPYGAVKSNTVRTFSSHVDDHGFLVFRDPDDTLSVLDPYRSLVPRPLATSVTAVRSGLSGKEHTRDVLWLIEQGKLTQRTLDGERLVALGSSVTGMTLDPQLLRVAYVDGGDLYEAVAPTFAPNLLASDACSPRYSKGNLEFLWPCEQELLTRVQLSNGKYQTFDDGVFASSVQEGVQLDYVHDADGANQLVVTFPDDDARMPVTPSLLSSAVYVLDGERIAGLDASAQFGIWDRRSESFSPMLSSVSNLVSQHHGKTHSYSWLVYHDVMDDLGTLTLLDQNGAASAEIARAVPPPAQRGFLIEDGRAVPHYPFDAPLVMLLEDASPLAPGRFQGRLKVLSMNGEPSAVLAEDVSSYVLVASPAPGVLYGVEEGPARGLWYAPL